MGKRQPCGEMLSKVGKVLFLGDAAMCGTGFVVPEANCDSTKLNARLRPSRVLMIQMSHRSY